MIKYPISFWMTFCIVIASSLLAVAWHGVLFLIAVVNVACIMALPAISRKEMDYRKFKIQQEKSDVVISDPRETPTGNRHGNQTTTAG